MKKLLALLLCTVMLLSFTACEEKSDKKSRTKTKYSTLEETEAPAETFPEAEPENDLFTEPDVTEYPVPPETQPTEPEVTEYPVPPETRPEETPELPYIEKIKWKDQPIYSGPGYAYHYVGTVEIAGAYTIVDEKYDDDGHLWGKLKSGVGWIDLTNSRYSDGHREEDPQLLIAYRVGDTVMGDVFYMDDESEYAFRIGITATKDVEFRFYGAELTDTIEPGELLTMGSLSADQTFVAQISLPGDSSSYFIEAEDIHGNTVLYLISDSGKDGSLVFIPCDL